MGVITKQIVYTLQTMKTFTFPLFIMLVLFASSCKTPQMLVDTDLKQTSAAMPVKGRYGLLIGQKLSFGSYQTGEVQRGWIKSRRFNFLFIDNTNSKQAINFSLTDSLGNNYTAQCLSKLKKEQTDLDFFLGHSNNPILNELMRIDEEYDETFAVTIEADSSTVWNMLVANRHIVRQRGKYKGLLYSQTQTIEINPIRHVEGTKVPFPDVIGFEYILDGKVIGAVETLNKGRIWISPDIDTQLKGILAAASAALLLQTDLETV